MNTPVRTTLRRPGPTFRPRFEALEDRCTPSFGVGGYVTTDIAAGDGEHAWAVAVQPDGKTVAAGPGGVVRYNADGSLDATFNAGGVQPGVVPIADPINDMAVLADGKIVIGGSRLVRVHPRAADDYAFMLLRLNPDGTLDATFGTNGTVVQTFGKTSGDALRSLAVEASGRVVAVGRINGSVWGVARFNPNGSLDTSFDRDGWLTTVVVANKNSRLGGVAVQPDGGIVVAGTVFMGFPTYADAAVVRYLPNGVLDTSFGGTGKVLVDFGPEYPAGSYSNDEITDITLQADGRIVFVGQSDPSLSDSYRGLIGRLNSNGTLDATFGGDGRVVVTGPLSTASDGYTYNAPVYFVSVAVQADGRIVAWSPYSASGGQPAIVARVNTDGTLDTTFSGDGIATLSWAGGPQRDPNHGGIAVQPDGKIVVAGGHYSYTTNQIYFDLARLNADGTLDI